MSNSSFLPEDYLERKAQQRTNIFSLVMFVLVMGAVIAAYFVTNRQRTEVQAQLADVNGRTEVAAKRLEQLDEFQKNRDQMIQKARVTSSLIEKVPRSLIFSEVTNNMPLNVSLLEAGLETKVVQGQARALTSIDQARDEKHAAEARKNNPLSEVKDTDVRMNLVGIAPTDVQVAQFMAALSRSPLFGDLNLAYSEEVQVSDETMRRFRIELKINQDVDLEKLKPAMVRRDAMGGKTIVMDKAGKLTKPKPTAPLGVQVSD